MISDETTTVQDSKPMTSDPECPGVKAFGT